MGRGCLTTSVSALEGTAFGSRAVSPYIAPWRSMLNFTWSAERSVEPSPGGGGLWNGGDDVSAARGGDASVTRQRGSEASATNS